MVMTKNNLILTFFLTISLSVITHGSTTETTPSALPAGELAIDPETGFPILNAEQHQAMNLVTSAMATVITQRDEVYVNNANKALRAESGGKLVGFKKCFKDMKKQLPRCTKNADANLSMACVFEAAGEEGDCFFDIIFEQVSDEANEREYNVKSTCDILHLGQLVLQTTAQPGEKNISRLNRATLGIYDECLTTLRSAAQNPSAVLQ